MLKRFTSEDGHRLKIKALLSQKIISGNLEIADQLANTAKFIELSKGQILIEQNAADNDVYMIITGSFDVVINGRKIARRFPNDHVGEMAAIEMTQRRSASVIASEQSVVAQISEAEFSEIGKRFPEVYLAVARELSRRLHQRNVHVAAPRERTKVFLISSAESLEVARIIQNSFAHDKFLPVLWTDGVFRVASYPMQSLIDEVTDSDFAIAIAHGDDTTSTRGKEWPVPRDNVIFELGLFMGRLGKDRAILMEPRDEGVKLPSDLTGITTIPYRYEVGRDSVAMMAPACNVLREHILRLGPNV